MSIYDEFPPITRCSVRHCRTTVDLDDDPAALCEGCGEVVCDLCGPCDCGEAS